MKIYTKKGDSGETSLYGGKRVAKNNPRVNAYGTYDELNAILGMVLSERELSNELRERLTRIQGELFQLGAEVATPGGPAGKSPAIGLIENQEVEALEQEIDAMEASMEPLKHFILPAGSKAATLLHFARTVARRAERELVTLSRMKANKLRPVLLQYANRLNDYLFVCARYANHQLGVADVPWIAPTKRFK